ncbi:FMN-binding negative transcriptional regulator [Aquabacterium sp. A7-Y]|uniref:FMN-binding negative transcriptional regulator n=1 Tax=Aquabacterium sp. A7-Y TaxID=1349605 RepID=UPI00223CE6A5|nr:FMN-binding negative transcriptional regulator [Aquabacterium sp. A7-Y]MCW7540398.1 FMN-binding negative transcriptional regulator [Aquabacterium sp. A7-Y]
MHIRDLFAQQDQDTLRGFLQAWPLAALITAQGSHPEVHLFPLDLVPGAEGEPDRLRGHCPVGHPFLECARLAPEVVALFQGPNAYISPRWYVNGQRSRSVAPGWNYVAAEARGPVHIVDDASFLRRHLEALVKQQESSRVHPWSLEEADPHFISASIERLVGFEIEVRSLKGNWFLSQQRTAADRVSVAKHLSMEVNPLARELSAWVGHSGE